MNQLGSQVNELTESNRQLRDELEQTRAQSGSFANINDTCRSRGFQAGPSGHSTEDRVIAMAQALDKSRVALAAAKEALEELRVFVEPLLISSQDKLIQNALALIAECEKEAA